MHESTVRVAVFLGFWWLMFKIPLVACSGSEGAKRFRLSAPPTHKHIQHNTLRRLSLLQCQTAFRNYSPHFSRLGITLDSNSFCYPAAGDSMWWLGIQHRFSVRRERVNTTELPTRPFVHISVLSLTGWTRRVVSITRSRKQKWLLLTMPNYCV